MFWSPASHSSMHAWAFADPVLFHAHNSMVALKLHYVLTTPHAPLATQDSTTLQGDPHTYNSPMHMVSTRAWLLALVASQPAGVCNGQSLTTYPLVHTGRMPPYTALPSRRHNNAAPNPLVPGSTTPHSDPKHLYPTHAQRAKAKRMSPQQVAEAQDGTQEPACCAPCRLWRRVASRCLASDPRRQPAN